KIMYILLLLAGEFYVCLLDPFGPVSSSTTAYSNNLYSKDFFQIVGDHLEPGGVFCLYMDEKNVMPKTLAAAFDYIRIYDGMGIASGRKMKMNPVQWKTLLANLGEDAVRSVNEASSTGQVFLGEKDYALEWGKGLPINQDQRPVAEYYLGLYFREWLFKTKKTVRNAD
ncbi:MAG: hypothetical protein D3906_00620, partial [Candidatus Electrothrix sp. AUS1_2]|nr:hypothetical protein [Candidatus Electrothrix sp. AUS1_2]